MVNAMSKEKYELARNFCTGQDLATLGERESAWGSTERLRAFRKKMATVYANFFLGYQLNLMEEKENIAPPNQIYLRFENEAIKLGKPKGGIQASMYDKDREKIFNLHQLGVPFKKIIEVHLGYGKYLSLRDYIRKRGLDEKKET